MQMASPRRYIIAAAPSADAGIGEALRQAFGKSDLAKPMFERLIAQLNKVK